jgi:TonB-linked SusC/RagA family outer membrane protein
MRKLLILFLLNFHFFYVLAQSKTVKGKVADDKNIPLPGVTVSAVGANNKTVTAKDGSFSLSVPLTVNQLEFTYVGYEVKRVNVRDINNTLINLVPSIASIGEVVVTGYTTVKKSQYSGAAAKVSKEKVNYVPNASFDQILQGRVPGLLVTAGSGQPGSAARVQIRGQSSISGGSSPLYIVDGVPIEDANFRSLNPNDFESVDVLRDAIATAQYGNRGSAGVIVITTKRGRAGKAVLSYSGQYGITQAGEEKFDMANSAELLQIQEMIGKFNNTNLPGWFYSPNNPRYATLPPEEQAAADRTLDSLHNVNTNWKDIFFRDGNFQSHDLNLSGGTGNTQFYLGGGYYVEDGIGLRSDLKRYSFRANIDHKTDRFSVSLSSAVGVAKSNFIESENSVTLANPFAAVYLALPYQKLYNPDGSINVGGGHTGPNAYDRVVKSTSLGNNQIKVNASLNVNYNITSNIYIGGMLGLDYRQTIFESSVYPNSYAANNDDFPAGPDPMVPGSVGQGSYSTGLTNYFEYIVRAFGGFRKVFNEKHDMDIQAVSEYTRDYQRGFNYTGYGIDPKLLNTPAGITPGDLNNRLIANVGGYKTQRTLYAAMILAKYTYAGKYTLNATFRRDGTSQLPEDSRFQNFYSAGVTWNVLGENFASGWSKNVNSLLVRFSYGESANADGFYFGYFGYLPTYSAGSYAGFPTTFPSNAGNKNVTWERIKTFNLGFDFAFLKNMISGSLDLYNKKTDDNIITQKLSYTSGFADLPVNAGVVRNQGVELALNGNIIQTKNFLWSVGGNVSYNENKVISLKQVNEFEQGTELVKVGLPLGSHYIVKWGGVDAASGAPLYYTKDGKLTSVYSDDYRVSEFGTYNAPWIGGFNTSISWKGFSLQTFFTFQQGFSRFNNQDFFQLNHAFVLQGYNVRNEMLTMWQKPGDVTNIQSPLYQRQFVSKDIQDASYLRFRNAIVAYNFPAALLSKTKVLSAARIFVQGQNLFTWTNWVGFDPEDNDNIAQYEYPTPRTYTIGVNVSFQ